MLCALCYLGFEFLWPARSWTRAFGREMGLQDYWTLWEMPGKDCVYNKCELDCSMGLSVSELGWGGASFRFL